MTRCVLWFKGGTHFVSQCELYRGVVIAVIVGKERVSDFSELKEQGLQKITVNGKAVLRLK